MIKKSKSSKSFELDVKSDAFNESKKDLSKENRAFEASVSLENSEYSGSEPESESEPEEESEEEIKQKKELAKKEWDMHKKRTKLYEEQEIQKKIKNSNKKKVCHSLMPLKYS